MCLENLLFIFIPKIVDLLSVERRVLSIECSVLGADKCLVWSIEYCMFKFSVEILLSQVTG